MNLSNVGFSWNFKGGRLVHDVQELVLANNTEKVLTIAPASGKRWEIMNVKARNTDNVARQVSIEKLQDAAGLILVKTLTSEARNAGAILNWPNSTVATATDPHGSKQELLEFPNRLRTTWAPGGVSAGGTDADGLVIEYLEMDVTQLVKKVKVDDVVFKALDGVKAVLTGITQAHPATVGFLIMAACTGGIIATGKTQESKNIWEPLQKLYNGAQELTKAAVIVPVVSGGLGALTAVLERKK